MPINIESSEIWAFLLFAIVGLATAGVNFIALALLLEMLKLDYRVAVSVAYIAGVVFHFVANKSITFKQRNLIDIHNQIARYLVLVAINYLLTIAIVIFVVEVLVFAPYMGLLLSMGATIVTGYLLSRFWVFKRSTNGY